MKLYYFLLFALLMIGFPVPGKCQEKMGKENELSIKAKQKDVSGENASDGFLHIEVSGGKAPYKITCFSPYSVPATISASEVTFSTLKKGNYLFVIQDSSGKTTTKEFVITNKQ